MRGDTLQERIQLMQWSLRVKREAFLKALAEYYYSLCENPRFWVYACVFMVGVILAGHFVFRSQEVVALGIGLFLASLAWAIMADAAQEEMRMELEERLRKASQR